MHPLHALHIPSWYPATPEDGNGGFFRDQALAISNQGCKVGVIYCDQASLRRKSGLLRRRMGLQVEDDSGIATYRWNSVRWFPSMPRANSRNWLRRGRQLFDRYIADQGMPDVLHAQSLLYGGILASRLSKEYGIPYIVTEHSTAWMRGLVVGRQFRLAEQAVDAARALVAVGKPLSDVLEGHFPKSRFGEWQTVPNIVSRRFLEYPIGATSAKGEAFTYLFVGFLHKKKAVENLIHAFDQAFDAEQDVHLRIGGTGPEWHWLKSLTRNCGTRERIHFLGSLTRREVLGEMSKCDAFVLPSRDETFGVVVIEALAMGKPVVATRSGGPEGIITPNDGILLPPDDIDALSAALRSMREDHSKYRAETLRLRCKERFGPDAVAQRLLNIYSNAVEAA